MAAHVSISILHTTLRGGLLAVGHNFSTIGLVDLKSKGGKRLLGQLLLQRF